MRTRQRHHVVYCRAVFLAAWRVAAQAIQVSWYVKNRVLRRNFLQYYVFVCLAVNTFFSQTPSILCPVLTSFRGCSLIRVYAARYSIFSSYYTWGVCGYSDRWHSRLPCFACMCLPTLVYPNLINAKDQAMYLVGSSIKEKQQQKRNGDYVKNFFSGRQSYKARLCESRLT